MSCFNSTNLHVILLVISLFSLLLELFSKRAFFCFFTFSSFFLFDGGISLPLFLLVFFTFVHVSGILTFVSLRSSSFLVSIKLSLISDILILRWLDLCSFVFAFFSFFALFLHWVDFSVLGSFSNWHEDSSLSLFSFSPF